MNLPDDLALFPGLFDKVRGILKKNPGIQKIFRVNGGGWLSQKWRVINACKDLKNIENE